MTIRTEEVMTQSISGKDVNLNLAQQEPEKKTKEVLEAIEELDTVINSSFKLLEELDVRLGGVFREVGSSPTEAKVESKPVTRFTAPLAREIESHASRLFTLREIISGMLFRLEI